MENNWEIFQRWVGVILVEQSIEPENDIKLHIHGEKCDCSPNIDWCSGVKNIVHNSFDKREIFEEYKSEVID